MATTSESPKKAVKKPAKKPNGMPAKARAKKAPALTPQDDHLAKVHAAEQLVATLEASKLEQRDRARATLGVTGSDDTTPLRKILREHDVSIYPMVSLGILGIVDVFQAEAFTVLTPEMARSLGLSIGAVAGARTLAFLATIIAPLPVARLSQGRARRVSLCIITAVAWSLITLTTGFVTSLLALIGVLVFDGLSTGSVAALHQPLLMDSYPPPARGRVLSTYRAVTVLGTVGAPLMISLLAGPFNLTWRGVFLVLGGLSLVGTLASAGLRDPGYGKFDTEALRANVQEAHQENKGKNTDLEKEDVELGFFEICRRLLLIPTIRRLCAGFMVFGILLIPFATYLSFYLDQRWGLTPAARGLFFSFTGSASILGLAWYGRRAEKMYRENPARVVDISAKFLAVGIVSLAIGIASPALWLVVVFFTIALTMIALLQPGLYLVMLSVVDSAWRPQAAALIGIFTASGSLLGVFFLTGIDRRFGVGGAVVSLAVPGVLGALVIRTAKKTVVADLDRMIDTVIEDEEIRQLSAAGGRLPMLACRGIDFAYGQLQVLFDVNFTVDDGEMVALLGTNGAGKSTLLKVISGIGLPSTGSVRFRGQEITYLDAERRVTLGITQIPGGRAVFGPMNVVENLRAFGYTMGRDRKKVEDAIERCLTAFPRLEERKGSLASTLSGGEQQMLGLSKALILRPRLLVIDELSLGLAPVIVGQLLDMVREINDEGTAVVLVEQSVNIALGLVDHAYFMEKGEMRFDGTSAELLARDDLLRAVFLEGADAGSKK